MMVMIPQPPTPEALSSEELERLLELELRDCEDTEEEAEDEEDEDEKKEEEGGGNGPAISSIEENEVWKQFMDSSARMQTFLEAAHATTGEAFNFAHSMDEAVGSSLTTGTRIELPRQLEEKELEPLQPAASPEKEPAATYLNRIPPLASHPEIYAIIVDEGKDASDNLGRDVEKGRDSPNLCGTQADEQASIVEHSDLSLDDSLAAADTSTVTQTGGIASGSARTPSPPPHTRHLLQRSPPLPLEEKGEEAKASIPIVGALPEAEDIQKFAQIIARKATQRRRECTEVKLKRELETRNGGRLQAWWRAAKVRLKTGPRLAAARESRALLALERSNMRKSDERSCALREHWRAESSRQRRAEAAEEQVMDREERHSRDLQRQRIIQDQIEYMKVQLKEAASAEAERIEHENILMCESDALSRELRRVALREHSERQMMRLRDRESHFLRERILGDSVNERAERERMQVEDTASHKARDFFNAHVASLTHLQQQCKERGRLEAASLLLPLPLPLPPSISHHRRRKLPSTNHLGLLRERWDDMDPYASNSPYLLISDKTAEARCDNRKFLSNKLRHMEPTGAKTQSLSGPGSLVPGQQPKQIAAAQSSFNNDDQRSRPLKVDMLSHLLQPLDEIEHLELCVEELTDIDILLKARKLKSLALNVNHLREIASLASCRELQELSVSDNKLVSLSGLRGLDCLRELRVDMNRLMDLGSLENLPSLTDLAAGSNLISSLPPVLHLPALQKLSLYHNKLSHIPVTCFGAMKHLLHLDLGRNSLRSLEGAALSACPALVRIVLSHNHLESVPAPLHLPLLRELWLSGNCLHSLEPWSRDKAFIVPSLVSLHVDDNQILSLNGDAAGRTPLAGAPLLSEINVSFNLIEQLSDIIPTLITCGRLRKLQLHDNPVSRLEGYRKEIIGSCSGLQLLDGEIIEAQEWQHIALELSGGKSHVVMPWLRALVRHGLGVPPANQFCWSSARRWAWNWRGWVANLMRPTRGEEERDRIQDLEGLCRYEMDCIGGGAGFVLLQGRQRRDEASVKDLSDPTNVPSVGRLSLKLNQAMERLKYSEELMNQHIETCQSVWSGHMVAHEEIMVQLKWNAASVIQSWMRKKNILQRSSHEKVAAAVHLQSAYRGYHVRRALSAALASARYIDEELESFGINEPLDVHAYIGAIPEQLTSEWDAGPDLFPARAVWLKREQRVPAAPAWDMERDDDTTGHREKEEKHSSLEAVSQCSPSLQGSISGVESRMVNEWGLKDPRLMLARRRRLRKMERMADLRSKRSDPYFRLRSFERNARLGRGSS